MVIPLNSKQRGTGMLLFVAHCSQNTKEQLWQCWLHRLAAHATPGLTSLLQFSWAYIEPKKIHKSHRENSQQIECEVLCTSWNSTPSVQVAKAHRKVPAQPIANAKCSRRGQVILVASRSSLQVYIVPLAFPVVLELRPDFASDLFVCIGYTQNCIASSPRYFIAFRLCNFSTFVPANLLAGIHGFGWMASIKIQKVHQNFELLGACLAWYEYITVGCCD